MKTITKISLALTVVAVTVMGVVIYQAINQPAAPVVSQPQKSLVAQINDVRTQANKPPLMEDQGLDKAAQAKVDDQVARGYWAHSFMGDDVFRFVRPIYTALPGKFRVLHFGENLARCGRTDGDRVNSWVHSPEHYATMVGDYTRIGWAEKVNPKDNNCVYTVTEFSDY